MNIRPYTNALRAQGGWIADGDSNGGGQRVVSFKKLIGLRELRLQLWEDGRHRVSHAYAGNETTYPTAFHDVEGMAAAIATETARRDWKPYHATVAAMADAFVDYARVVRAEPGCSGVSADDMLSYVTLILRRSVGPAA